MAIRSVVLCEVANRQTDRQTDRRRIEYNLLGGGNHGSLQDVLVVMNAYKAGMV